MNNFLVLEQRELPMRSQVLSSENSIDSVHKVINLKPFVLNQTKRIKDQLRCLNSYNSVYKECICSLIFL